jgi:membrane-anchored protein YejM (alkaline phosphatase superfamily)
MKHTFYKSSFIYFFITSIVLGALFVSYLGGSAVAQSMDTQGWCFYVTACMSWAAVFALFPYILSTLLYAISRRERVAATTQVVLTIVLMAYFLIDGMIYAQYRFHINGFVLDMLFSEGAGDIFQFNASIYLKLIAAFAVLVLAAYGLWIGCKRIACKWHSAATWSASLLLVAALLFSNGFHAYAAVVKIPSVIRSAPAVPYYFPLTANRFLHKMGVVSKETLTTSTLGGGNSSGLNYPAAELVVEPDSARKNIVMIVIDSWNNRSWSPEVFPNIWNFSSRCTYYADHLSSSNGTTGSTFGMFFGLPAYFRSDIEAAGTQPLLVEQMLASGYDVKAFSSATLVYPPFARLLFANVPDLRIESKGKTVYERDCEITDEFISYINNDKDGNQPFYSLLFYDLAHGYELPEEKLTRFTPSWKFANYLALNNDADPTPFWNLYRNCLFQIDSLVGHVINSLEEKKLLDNTIVVITGDHGQEFNENKKNFWGHNSNYSPVQLRVPLLYFDASQAAAIRRHRTTHYDIAPTLLKSVLGVRNDVTDLGVGHLLEDSCSRDWHIVGNKDNYAFIREKDNTIIEKKYSGHIDVYDSLMNIRDDYKVNARELNDAILKLNKLYK